jgi:CubicO group peptidase (beta-lactamase class C family)
LRECLRQGSELAVLLLSALAANAGARELTRASLEAGSGYKKPVDLSEYTPLAAPAPPTQRFEGSLKLTRHGHNGFKSISLDPSFIDASHRDVSSLPEFDFEFVQDGNDLIPLRRGAIPGKHPSWEIILEPGRVWDEETDGGYSRAALPFAVEERNANCMHNGVLTFLFKSDGSVSHAAWQVGSETCYYEKFDAWGWLAAKYTPHAVTGASRVIATYRREGASRMPVRPIARLAEDHPGAVPANFGAAQDVLPENMTAYGFVMDGVHYTGGCQTRHGAYPFCDVLDLPSYSLAKSIVGAIALMRLEYLYPGTAKTLVRDYVPECATDDRWNGVTLENTLDMATGLYRSSVDQADENADGTGRFFFPTDHAHKIHYACREYERKSPPGSLWVYHTSDTYVLGTALNAFTRKHRGPAADFYRDLLVDALWKPLGLSPPVAVTRRTYDGVAQPFTGWGLTLHRDDIVKLAAFLSLNDGRIDDKRTLDPAMLATGLQRDPHDRGLQGSTPDFRYNNGFWAYDAARAIGCRGEVWIPYMSGFGGLQVVMLPNRMIYYYVSDGGEYRWADAAAEANRIRRFCEP